MSRFSAILAMWLLLTDVASIAQATNVTSESPISTINELTDSSITISPYRIVLNSQGQHEDVLVIIRKALPSGYRITGFQLSLLFDGIEVVQAYALRYCYVDDNFLASFDRTTIQENPDVLAMAGSEVLGRIEGTYTAENADGDIWQDTLSGQDLVEIMDPDWQMTVTKSAAVPNTPDILVGFDTDQQGSQNLLPWDRGQGVETSCGQTFSFSEPVRLDKITLKIKTTDVDISNKPAELWFGEGFHHVTDSGITSLIITPSENLPAAMGVEQIWYLTFDFDNQYLLADTDYAFLLRFASGGSGEKEGLEANVFAVGEYVYEDGAAFIYSGNWSSTILNNELVFYLHGEILSQSPLLGDANIDFRVDFEDYATIAQNWLGDYTPECCGADISCDGQVDYSDLGYLLLNWLDRL